MNSIRKNKIKLYKDDIFLVVALYLSLFNFVTLPFARIIRNVLVIVLLLYVIQNIKRLFQRENKIIELLVLSYSIWMIIDSFFYNEYIYLANVNSVLNSVIKGFIVFESVFAVDIYYKKRGISRLLDILFGYVAVFFVISNSWIVITGFEKTPEDYYLIGTKFSTSYLNILFIVLIFLKNRFYKKGVNYIGIASLFLYSFYFFLRLECSTALIALFLLGVFLLFKLQLYKLFSNRLFFVVFYVVLFLFIYLYNLVLSNVYVSHVIVNILGESLTMTGRTHIYQRLPEMMDGKWLTGFGSGRTGMILNFYTGCNDAQNGVWQIICENGFIGFVLYALTSLKLNSNSIREKITCSYYLSIYFVIMLVLGFVEITLDTRLLVLLFIMYLYNDYFQKSTESLNGMYDHQ